MEATTKKLTLTRKRGERLVIDGPCVIEVVRVIGKDVRLRVEAEGHVRILRAELLEEREEG